MPRPGETEPSSIGWLPGETGVATRKANRRMDTRPPEAFPNFEDQKALRRVIRAGNYSTLTDDQLWRHHAYDYAWRRVYLGDRNAFKVGDEDGKWFDAANVDLAEQMYRRLADRPRRRGCGGRRPRARRPLPRPGPRTRRAAGGAASTAAGAAGREADTRGA